MNWQAIGATGEVIGAIAVVVTLAFLALQIRQSQRAQREANALARSDAVNKSYDRLAEHRRLIATDPEITRIWIAGCAGENLNEIEAQQFFQLAINYLAQYTIWQRQAKVVGLGGVADIAARALSEDLKLHPGLRQIWNWIADRELLTDLPEIQSSEETGTLMENASSAGMAKSANQP